jgi:hypothetical protein
MDIISRYLGRSESGVAEFAVLTRREIERYAEPIGANARTIDNSGSDVELARSLTISNSAEYQFRADVENIRKSGTSGSLGGAAHGIGAKLSAQVEQAVKTGISTLEIQRHSVEEKVEFRVPARTVLTITLTWKRIWQRGEITLRSKLDEVIVLPYEESVGVDFDLSAVTSP